MKGFERVSDFAFGVIVGIVLLTAMIIGCDHANKYMVEEQPDIVQTEVIDVDEG